MADKRKVVVIDEELHRMVKVQAAMHSTSVKAFVDKALWNAVRDGNLTALGDITHTPQKAVNQAGWMVTTADPTAPSWEPPLDAEE